MLSHPPSPGLVLSCFRCFFFFSGTLGDPKPEQAAKLLNQYAASVTTMIPYSPADVKQSVIGLFAKCNWDVLARRPTRGSKPPNGETLCNLIFELDVYFCNRTNQVGAPWRPEARSRDFVDAQGGRGVLAQTSSCACAFLLVPLAPCCSVSFFGLSPGWPSVGLRGHQACRAPRQAQGLATGAWHWYFAGAQVVVFRSMRTFSSAGLTCSVAVVQRQSRRLEVLLAGPMAHRFLRSTTSRTVRRARAARGTPTARVARCVNIWLLSIFKREKPEWHLIFLKTRIGSHPCFVRAGSRQGNVGGKGYQGGKGKGGGGKGNVGGKGGVKRN